MIRPCKSCNGLAENFGRYRRERFVATLFAAVSASATRALGEPQSGDVMMTEIDREIDHEAAAAAVLGMCSMCAVSAVHRALGLFVAHSPFTAQPIPVQP
jgi:hypothetical protein